MKYSSTGLLDQLQTQTENMLNTAVQEWQMMSPAHFSASPSAGSWSAAQCLDHLNGYGDYYLPLLEGALRQAKQQKLFSASFRSGWLGDYFTRLMEPPANGTPAKKMKAVKQHIPAADTDSDAVIAKFISQQEKMLELLEMARGLQLGLRTIPVSIAPFIRMKTGDTFRFVIAHSRRHVAQAVRALAATGGKKPLSKPGPGSAQVALGLSDKVA